jgi:hypothetical protein
VAGGGQDGNLAYGQEHIFRQISYKNQDAYERRNESRDRFADLWKIGKHRSFFHGKSASAAMSRCFENIHILPIQLI